jgi:hypothetical protein
MSCFDNLTGGFEQDCQNPIKSGLRSAGIIINTEDIAEWITTGSSNQFIPVLNSGKTAYPIEVLGAQPFNGTNVASAIDDFSRNFTKTVVFNIPNSGSAAALKVEQLTKSTKGFVIIVEGKDAGGDSNGNFIIFGKDEPLLCSVAKDYVAGVSAPVVTATSIEYKYENFLFQTDRTSTKQIFDALYSADLANRLYDLTLYIDSEDDNAIKVRIRKIYGNNPGDNPGYTLVVCGVYIGTFAVITPSGSDLSGDVVVDCGIETTTGTSYVIIAVLSKDADETAGVPKYFIDTTISGVQDIS